jgi:Protein of unknown function (DUF2851).
MTPADRYRETLAAVGAPTVHEGPPSRERLSELELQARIYAGDCGIAWRGEDGETVEVVHFGSWNREPGPDFCGARVRIDGVEHTGDIEVDPDVRDWENHGHSRNPHYNRVVLHLFRRRGPRRFFTRTSDHRAVTQVCLPPAAAARPRAALPDRGLDGAAARTLIEAAAQFRFHRKAERFQRSVRLCGAGDALFQGIATGLGYKNNKIPFLLVAQRAGLDRAMARTGEALLFGLAGFLRAEDFTRGDEAARRYLRELWENWWTIRDGEARLILADSAWKFTAVRPANHPHRRMGALAAVARSFRRLARCKDPDDFEGILTGLGHGYWSFHYSVAGHPLPRPAALIGAERAREITVNTLLPSLPVADGWRLLRELPGAGPNERVRKALTWICGTAETDLLRSALHQQGLLQLHDDFFPRDAGEIWRAYAKSTGRVGD